MQDPAHACRGARRCPEKRTSAETGRARATATDAAPTPAGNPFSIGALEWRSMNVVLISTYELGRQPLGLAAPLAHLRAAGCVARGLDLSVGALRRWRRRGSGPRRYLHTDAHRTSAWSGCGEAGSRAQSEGAPGLLRALCLAQCELSAGNLGRLCHRR